MHHSLTRLDTESVLGKHVLTNTLHQGHARVVIDPDEGYIELKTLIIILCDALSLANGDGCGSLGRASDSRSTDPRFEPSQKHKNNL